MVLLWKKGYRSKGIARRILKELEAVASFKGLQKVTLEVLDSNNRAYSLYKKLGYQDIKEVNSQENKKESFKQMSTSIWWKI